MYYFGASGSMPLHPEDLHVASTITSTVFEFRVGTSVPPARQTGCIQSGNSYIKPEFCCIHDCHSVDTAEAVIGSF